MAYSNYRYTNTGASGYCTLHREEVGNFRIEEQEPGSVYHYHVIEKVTGQVKETNSLEYARHYAKWTTNSANCNRYEDIECSF